MYVLYNVPFGAYSATDVSKTASLPVFCFAETYDACSSFSYVWGFYTAIGTTFLGI
jgi:hypothetical protein